MIVDCKATDILTENHLTGLAANYMIPSLERAGIDVEKLRAGVPPDAAGVEDNVKAWRDLWSAGHGVSVIDDVPPTAELVDRLEAEYRAASGVAADRG
jgi:nitronate monooxygenase